MTMRAACPHCAAACSVPDEARGQVVKCPRCQKPFRVSAPASADAITADPGRGCVPAAPAKEDGGGRDDDAPAKPSAEPAVKTGGSRGRRRWSAAAVVGLIVVCAGAVVGYYHFKPELAVAVNGDNGASPPGDPPPEADRPPKGVAKRAPLVRAAASVPITPAPLDGDRATVPLAAPITDVAVGGGGRFLVLHLAKARKLAVFDASAAKIVKELPLDEDYVKVAAGMDKLLVVYPDQGLVECWSLPALEKEASAGLLLTGRVAAASMGSATDSPLVLLAPGAGRSGLAFLDVLTLTEVAADPVGWDNRQFSLDLRQWRSEFSVRTSADGRLISTGPSTGSSVLLLGENSFKPYRTTWPPSPVVPGPDGRTLFTAHGLYTADLKTIGEEGPRRYTLPALHGNYYLTISYVLNKIRETVGTEVVLRVLGDARPLATLTDLEGLGPWDRPGAMFPAEGRSLLLDKRLFLIPGAKLLVTIPPSEDRLLLRRFDPDEALEKSGFDYLLVTSQPPTRFRPGTEYGYQLGVKSKKGGVKYTLESGPPGMALSPEGKLTWDVPGDFARAEVSVVIDVSDSSGQTTLHTFWLAVKDGG